VTGPEPSERVAAFYYPWYRNLETDGKWDHWGESKFHPPMDIASDYYPALGTYSVADEAVLAQHMAWLRQAGVGLIISSWWGQGEVSDQAVRLLMDVADHYGIKVAFHIEPYSGRTAENLVADVRYIYFRYGEHPAFFRTTATSRWSTDDRPKGLFYLWASSFPDSNAGTVSPDYWRTALDEIHATEDGAIVLADNTFPEMVTEGHFDGCYNYAVLDKYQEGAYDWAFGLPAGAWYVPGINPGFSAFRIGYPDDEYTPRRDGTAYDERWQAALGAGVEPETVTITSFNEWHEGTQIEPVAVGVESGFGYEYPDYGALPPDGYLTRTKDWADTFLAMEWPETAALRVRLMTTSDWTDLYLISGATWLRPDLISASEEIADTGMFGTSLALSQPLDRAENGGQVEAIFDLLFMNWEDEDNLVFEIERGGLGYTRVELFRFVNDELVLAETLIWDGWNNSGRNTAQFEVPADNLFGETP
jgi:hypothetical protein